MIRISLAVLCVLVGCSGDAPPAKTNGLTPVRVQLNWVPEPEFGGLYAAQLQGFFKAEGLDVTLIKGSAGVPSAQLAASGKVEFGVVSADQVVTLRTRGAPLKAVFASFQTAPRAIVVHADSPHQTLESLWKSDAQIAVEPGHPFARWLDRIYGGTALKKVASSGGLAGFIGNPKSAQAVYIFAEPVELARRGIKTRTFKVAESGFNPYAVVLATRDAYLKDHRPVVDKFVRALRKGWAHYLKDPGPTNVEMAKLNSAMTADAMDIAARLATPYIQGDGPLGQMSTARWQALRDQLVQLDPSLAKAPSAPAYFEDVQ